jgi:hypothetical protein
MTESATTSIAAVQATSVFLDRDELRVHRRPASGVALVEDEADRTEIETG